MALPEVAPVRAGEELDARALAEYLQDKLEGAGQGITIEQFPGGHSNLTYLVCAGGYEYVLRRPPLGPVIWGVTVPEGMPGVLSALTGPPGCTAAGPVAGAEAAAGRAVATAQPSTRGMVAASAGHLRRI